MKITLVLVSIALGLSSAGAQERMERKEALKYAFFLSLDLKRLQDTPIPTDVDVKRPVAMRDGDYGALVLPEAKLTADSIARTGETLLPVGQLWLRRLTPVRDGEAVPGGSLRMIEVVTDSQSGSAAQCALGVKANGSGSLELWIFGKGKEPVLKVPLKRIEATQDMPIAMDAERADESGKIILKFLGRYQATIPVTDLAD